MPEPKFFGIGKTTEEENAEKSEQLRNAITALDLQVTDLSIEVNDDVVKLWGENCRFSYKRKSSFSGRKHKRNFFCRR